MIGAVIFDFDGLILDNETCELHSHSPNTDTSCTSISRLDYSRDCIRGVGLSVSANELYPNSS
jgi:hypothetical protein